MLYSYNFINARGIIPIKERCKENYIKKLLVGYGFLLFATSGVLEFKFFDYWNQNKSSGPMIFAMIFVCWNLWKGRHEREAISGWQCTFGIGESS